MQVVVDTNVWLSYLLFGGRVSQLFRQFSAYIHLYHSLRIEAEFTEKCQHKFKLEDEIIQSFVAEIHSVSTLETPTGTPPSICRDPNDNHVLHLCQHVKADVLLTGDKDLLVLKTFEDTRIRSPKQFAELLRG